MLKNGCHSQGVCGSLHHSRSPSPNCPNHWHPCCSPNAALTFAMTVPLSAACSAANAPLPSCCICSSGSASARSRVRPQRAPQPRTSAFDRPSSSRRSRRRSALSGETSVRGSSVIASEVSSGSCAPSTEAPLLPRPEPEPGLSLITRVTRRGQQAAMRQIRGSFELAERRRRCLSGREWGFD